MGNIHIKRLLASLLSLAALCTAYGQDFAYPDYTALKQSPKTVIIEGDANSFEINFQNYYAEVNEATSNNLRYIHCFIVDRNTGSPLQGQNSFFTVNYGQISDEHGLFVSSVSAINVGQWYTEDRAKIKVTKPSGKNWSDVNIICVISDDAAGFSQTGNVVTSGATDLKLAFVFNLMSTTDPQLNTFNHYQGFSGRPLDEKWRQQVHTWTYNVYVKPGESLDLKLPFTYGNVLEPAGYLRWYNYDTDAASPNLHTFNNSTDLKHFPNGDGSRGLMVWNQNQNTENASSTTYNAPAGGWDGEVIACDVSRYVDGLDESKKYLLHEPTLSMRYIFNVRPAEEIADAIKQAILSGRENVLEDNGYITVGVKDGGSSANLRVALHDVKDYYFYNFEYSNKVVPEGDVQESYFGGELLQATSVRWFVYDISGKYGKELTQGSYENGRMMAVSLNNLSGSFNALDGSGASSSQNFTYRTGDIAYIVAYAADDVGHMCPIAKFTCRFSGNHPMTIDEMPEHRKVSYLDREYTKVAEITFDNDCEGTSLAPRPTP